MLVLRFNAAMDMDAHRRKRLQELVDKETSGNVAAFARNHNQDATRLRQLLNENYRKGKGFGENAARRLETDLGLPALFFDFGATSNEAPAKHIYAPAEKESTSQSSDLISASAPSSGHSIKETLESNVGEELRLRPGRGVAVVGEVQGGPDGYISIDDYPVGHGCALLPEVRSRDKEAYGLKVRGDSMRPRIKSGEFIVVEPNAEALPGDDVVVRFVDGSAVVKELLWIRDGEVCLGSINNGVPPITRPMSSISAIHRVAAIMPRGSAIEA
ncbi:hypothetical protein WM15_29625 [Burkholderia ubonensis]|nr:hypothetical protein WM15_29625 [Burkholderia ubonensis]